MRTGGVRMAVLLIAALLAGACGTLTTSPAAGTFTPRTPNVLTVATTDIPSAGFWEGTPAHVSGGFEFELAKVLARRFGLKSVDIKVDRFNRIVTGHLDGADLALDLITPTAQRARSLTFSSPYLDAAPTAVTRTGTAVPDLDTARSLRWGAVRGTTFVGIIGSLIGPSDPVRIYEDTADMLELPPSRPHRCGAARHAVRGRDRQSFPRALARRRSAAGLGVDRGGLAVGLEQRAGRRFGPPRVHRRRDDRPPPPHMGRG